MLGEMISRVELLGGVRGHVGTPRSEFGPGIRSFASPPFVIFFRYTADDELEVVRILHERQALPDRM